MFESIDCPKCGLFKCIKHRDTKLKGENMTGFSDKFPKLVKLEALVDPNINEGLYYQGDIERNCLSKQKVIDAIHWAAEFGDNDTRPLSAPEVKDRIREKLGLGETEKE